MRIFSRMILLSGILIGMASQSGIYSKENVVKPVPKKELQSFERDPQGAANIEKSEILKIIEWNGYAIGLMKVYALFLVSVLAVVFWRTSSVAVFRPKKIFRSRWPQNLGEN